MRWISRRWPAQATAFVVARCPRQPRGTAKMTVTALRSLLRLCALRE